MKSEGGAGDASESSEPQETAADQKSDQLVENGSGDNNAEVDEQEAPA